MHKDLRPFFNPAGVAVIGASTNPTKLSYGVVRNLTEHGYKGAIYPVNPKGGKILGHRIYPTILDVPEPLDLGVIMLHASMVPEALEQCGERGLKTVIVISGGFRETGEAGVLLEDRLKDIIQHYGIRLVGPNCVGVMDCYLPLDTTFIAHMPAPGHIGFISHSGAICGGTIDWAIPLGVGFSRILSLGNQLDVDIADGIEIYNTDENTHVISIYAEGLPRGREFVESASRVYRDKPIVMLKAGLTTSGSRAVSSHTGALAGSKNAYLAACHRAGVLVVDSLQEQNDVAMALATQPLPAGNRVALLTNAGGPAALAADALDHYGLKLANLSEATKMKLSQVTPRDTQLDNPVDMLGGPSGAMFEKAGCILLADPGVDMLLSIFVPQAITPVMDVARGIIASAHSAGKPVVCCLVGGESITEAVVALNTSGVPFYQDPNRASRALAGLVEYRHLVERKDLCPVEIHDVDRDRARSIITQVMNEKGPGYLPPQAAIDILAAYGIAVPASGIATSVEHALSLAESFHYPVALKLVAKDVVHKTEAGGVALHLTGPDQVRQAYTGMTGGHPDGKVLVQKMAKAGTEVIIGIQNDPQFGPVLMFGAGGTYVEVAPDVAFRLAPLCAEDALSMIQETAVGRILEGIRGSTPGDIACIVDILCRVGQLASDFPCITELDINPLIVYPQDEGCSAVDVRITLGAQKD